MCEPSVHTKGDGRGNVQRRRASPSGRDALNRGAHSERVGIGDSDRGVVAMTAAPAQLTREDARLLLQLAESERLARTGPRNQLRRDQLDRLTRALHSALDGDGRMVIEL